MQVDSDEVEIQLYEAAVSSGNDTLDKVLAARKYIMAAYEHYFCVLPWKEMEAQCTTEALCQLSRLVVACGVNTSMVFFMNTLTKLTNAD